MDTYGASGAVDVDIEIVAHHHEDYKTDIVELIDSHRPVDVFLYWAGAKTNDLADKHYIHPIDQVWHDNHLQRVFPENISTRCEHNGSFYLLPYSYNTVGFFYNKRTFRDAGIARLPANWDDFLGCLDLLKRNGVTPLAVGTQYKWPAQFWFDYILLRTAGSIYRSRLLKLEASFSDNETVRAVQIWQDLIDEDLFVRRPETMHWTDSADQVMDGQAGMVLIGGWICGYWDSKGFAPGKDYGFFPFPQIDDLGEKAIVGPVNGWLLSSKSAHIDASLRLMPAFAQADLQRDWAVLGGTLPANLQASVADYDEVKTDMMAAFAKATTFEMNFDLDMDPRATETTLDFFARMFQGESNAPQDLTLLQQSIADLANDAWVSKDSGLPHGIAGAATTIAEDSTSVDTKLPAEVENGSISDICDYRILSLYGMVDRANVLGILDATRIHETILAHNAELFATIDTAVYDHWDYSYDDLHHRQTQPQGTHLETIWNTTEFQLSESWPSTLTLKSIEVFLLHIPHIGATLGVMLNCRGDANGQTMTGDLLEHMNMSELLDLMMDANIPNEGKDYLALFFKRGEIRHQMLFLDDDAADPQMLERFVEHKKAAHRPDSEDHGFEVRRISLPSGTGPSAQEVVVGDGFTVASQPSDFNAANMLIAVALILSSISRIRAVMLQTVPLLSEASHQMDLAPNHRRLASLSDQVAQMELRLHLAMASLSNHSYMLDKGTQGYLDEVASAYEVNPLGAEARERLRDLSTIVGLDRSLETGRGMQRTNEGIASILKGTRSTRRAALVAAVVLAVVSVVGLFGALAQVQSEDSDFWLRPMWRAAAAAALVVLLGVLLGGLLSHMSQLSVPKWAVRPARATAVAFAASGITLLAMVLWDRQPWGMAPNVGSIASLILLGLSMAMVVLLENYLAEPDDGQPEHKSGHRGVA